MIAILLLLLAIGLSLAITRTAAVMLELTGMSRDTARFQAGQYLGAPTGVADVEVGDTLTVYGRLAQLEELNHRKHGTSGMYAHLTAVMERAKNDDGPDEQRKSPRGGS